MQFDSRVFFIPEGNTKAVVQIAQKFNIYKQYVIKGCNIMIDIVWRKSGNCWESKVLENHENVRAGDVIRQYTENPDGRFCYTGGLYGKVYYCTADPADADSKRYYDVCTGQFMYELPYTEIIIK